VQIINYFEGGQADLVVCDGAPDGQISLSSINVMIIIHIFKRLLFKLALPESLIFIFSKYLKLGAWAPLSAVFTLVCPAVRWATQNCRP